MTPDRSDRGRASTPGRASRSSIRRRTASRSRWRHRHLLDVDVLSWADIELVMRTTDAMREVLARPIAKVPALRGRNVTILFYEASTRTRVSFEVAAKNLSADVVNIAAATLVGVEGRVARRHGPDGRGARRRRCSSCATRVSGAPYLAAETFSGSVLNGGDGWHAHPTQALLDLYTMRERFAGGSLEGRKVVILGDVLHSRVARSNIWTLTAAGADVWLCGPATLLRGFEAWAGAGRGGRAAVPRHDVDRRGAARRRRRHGPPDPEGADGVRAAAVAARIRGPLRADRERVSRCARPGRARHAPGPDERGRRDRRRRRGRRPVGDQEQVTQRRRGPDGAALPAGRHARDR